MIIECDNSHKNSIIEFIGDDYQKCLYIYIDANKYGIKSNEVRTFITKNDRIDAIYYNYRNGLHIYAKNNILNLEHIKSVIHIIKPKIICAEKKIIEYICSNINGDYNYEYGFIKKLRNRNLFKSERVRVATQNDICQIADLVFQDEGLSGGYTLNEIKTQIFNRMSDNFSRNYVLEDNDKIIAQASTGGEYENVSIINNVIVDKEYRRKGYGFEVVNAICYDLITDKEVYLVCYTSDAIELYEKIGFQTCAEWGKIIIK